MIDTFILFKRNLFNSAFILDLYIFAMLRSEQEIDNFHKLCEQNFND